MSLILILSLYVKCFCVKFLLNSTFVQEYAFSNVSNQNYLLNATKNEMKALIIMSFKFYFDISWIVKGILCHIVKYTIFSVYALQMVEFTLIKCSCFYLNQECYIATYFMFK